MIAQIEKSAESETGNASKTNGLFGKKDIIVVNTKLLLWFAMSNPDDGRIVRSGGGLLAGAWELEMKNSRPNLKINGSYAPNLLLPGSTPNLKKYSGADIFGKYPASNLIWGLEYSTNTVIGPKHGTDILSSDKGAFSADEGVFIQFTGTIRNSGTESGFESIEDTDPRPGVIGITTYTLTYRVPARRPEIIQEIELKPKENNFGPISNAVQALYLPGYPGADLSYAVHPEIMPVSPKLDLSSVSINKYFNNSCIKKVYFYRINFVKHKGSKFTAQTPAGKGKIACIGSPEYKVSFVCGYPTNDYIPKETFEEYLLEISDNQTSRKLEKFNVINYKLISSPGKTVTLKIGENLIMIMRYKFIDAREAVPPSEFKQ
jgi:hypothetical protein